MAEQGNNRLHRDTVSWTDSPSILFEKWWELLPAQWMSTPRKANAFARLIFLVGFAGLMYYMRTTFLSAPGNCNAFATTPPRLIGDMYASTPAASTYNSISPHPVSSLGRSGPTIALLSVVAVLFIVIFRWRQRATHRNRESGNHTQQHGTGEATKLPLIVANREELAPVYDVPSRSLDGRGRYVAPSENTPEYALIDKPAIPQTAVESPSTESPAADLPEFYDVDGRSYGRMTMDVSPDEGRDTKWLVGGDIDRSQQFDVGQ